MGNGRPGGLLFEDDLGLAVEFGPFGGIGNYFSLLDQIFKGLVAPLGAIGAVNAIAAEEDAEEVVRVAVVAGPAEQNGAVTGFFL
ncbi:MAG: hypothetical protein ACD_75C01818G0002, partial [uncultured bacterium]